MTHPTLLRQLKQLGLLDPDTPPDAAHWAKFLAMVDAAYTQANLPQDQGNDHLAAVIDSLGSGLCILNESGSLLSLNPAGEQMLGYREEELLGQPVLDIVEPMSEEERRRALTTTGLHRMMTGVQSAFIRRDAVFTRKDGSTFPVSYVLNPTVKDQQLLGAVLVFQDMTSYKQTEAELQRQLGETRLLNRVIAAATSELEPDHVLYTICEALAVALGLPQSGVAMLEEDGESLIVVTEYMEQNRLSSIGQRIDLRTSPATREVLQTRQPLPIANVKDDPRLGDFSDYLYNVRGTASMLLVPLLVRDQVIGTLGLDSPVPREFTPEELELAQNVAAAAGQALENARLYEALETQLKERIRAEDELRRQNEYLAGLHETTLGLIQRLDVDSLLEIIVARAGALMDTQHGFLYQFTPDQRYLVMRAGIGIFKRGVGSRLDRDRGLTGRVLAVGAPQVIDDYSQWAGALPEYAPALRAAVGVPLRLGKDIVGVIGLAHTRERIQFAEDQIELLSRFSQLAALALENARLYSAAQAEIAERRETQRALQQAKEAAEAASTAKSAFLANMSHELRTPLNSIIGYTELLLEGMYGDVTGKQASRLETVVRNGRRLLALINDVLDISKIESGQMELHPSAFSVAPIIEECLAGFEPLARKNGLELAADLPADLPKVWADRERVVQVITNLVSNALKFTPQGSVTVRARFAAPADVPNRPAGAHALDGPWTLVTVADTGIGIAPEDQAVIFDEFRQVDNSSTREYEGTGLGLAISQRLVRMMRGYLWVESMPGTGSHFHLLLPIHRPQDV